MVAEEFTNFQIELTTGPILIGNMCRHFFQLISHPDWSETWQLASYKLVVTLLIAGVLFVWVISALVRGEVFNMLPLGDFDQIRL